MSGTLDRILLASPDLRVALSGWGASIFFIEQRNPDGTWARITLADERMEDFLRNPFCFGATCGRFANRIGGGRFELDEMVRQLACNDGPNSLHGGDAPFHAREWTTGKIVREDGVARGVTFHLVSPDGDGGYPGELQVTATYQLTPDGGLSVDYEAVTDAPTIVNLTHHVYWNLSGRPQGTIADHVLKIPAGHFLPIDANHLVTGEIAAVAGGDFDFRSAALLGGRLASGNPQIRERRGFNHSFVLDGEGEGLRLTVRLEHPASGRWMEMRSDQPSVHLYTGGFLDGPVPGRDGPVWPSFAGVALEPGILPDAPNHPEFPGLCVLRPGEIYHHRIRWTFGHAKGPFSEPE
jgi:aldose 1-epimerase